MATSPVVPSGAPSPADSPKGGKPGDESKALREENAALQRTNRELAASEGYWKGVADSGRREPEAVDDPDEDALDPELADDNPDKTVDDFSAKGIGALERRGLITRKAAREMVRQEARKIALEVVGTARAEMGQDQTLLGDYPELKDPKSELFLETAKHYKAAVKLDPSMKNSPGALAMAAALARATLKKPAKVAADPDGEDPDPDDLDDLDPRERRRLERVAAQSGERGRRATADDGSDPDEPKVLGPQTRQLLEAMKITPEDYEKSRQAHPTDRPRRR